jgi:transposase InsO family protein
MFNKELGDLRIRDEIEKIIKEFPKYGYRPMTKELERSGFKINELAPNHKRVLRVMRENNLLCEIKKSFISTTDSDHNFKKYPNLLKKEKIEVTGINQVWVSDITYVRLPEGFIYLAVILDAYSRKVIGYCLSVNIDTDLVVTALEMAIRERRIIDAENKLIHHSDKGVQYASKTYTKKLKSVKIRISMSGTGKPWENGIAESFFKTLKTNEVYLNDYQNIYEAKTNLFRFLNDVYNEKRLHSSLGYLPPNEFEELEKSEKKVA